MKKMEWYRLAAEQNIQMNAIGVMYQNGEGRTEFRPQAFKMVSLAAENNNEFNIILEMYSNGTVFNKATMKKYAKSE